MERPVGDNPEVAAIERAMVALRRSQRRRTLQRLRGGDVPRGASFDVLDVIEAEAPVDVRGVAAALSVDQPRASKLVAQAVADGLARREADQADGRRTLLFLTADGQAMVDEAHRFRQSVVERVTGGWAPDERAQFARLFARFADGFTGLKPGP